MSRLSAKIAAQGPAVLVEGLGVSETDVGQNDIEAIYRVHSLGSGDNVKDEVLVVLKDKKIRDLIMVNSINLAECMDATGRATAGTRMEVPGWSPIRGHFFFL